MLKTLGISYSGPDARATCCAITWVSHMAMVELPRVGQPEHELLTEMARTDWTGITGAPFGWPDAMLDALLTYAETGRWPMQAANDRIRFRETDRFTRDLLADDHGAAVEIVPATHRATALATWRCARLLTQHAERTGRDPDRIAVPTSTGMDGPPDQPRGKVQFPPAGVIETHVPAALVAWDLSYDPRTFDPGGGDAARARRAALLDRIEHELPALLLPGDARSACLTCPDALEALIAAFVACAAATDATIKPTVQQRGAAQREGWIHVPVVELGALAPAL